MEDRQLSRFGFSFKRSGTHNARTMMLEELETLLAYVDNPEAGKSDYLQAIEEDNCLGKRSGRTRLLTYNHLVDLYSLDCNLALFRTLLYFWQRDKEGRPLLALLCTYARDSVFRSSAPFILEVDEGAVVERQALEYFLDSLESGRFSPATLKSTAQNINSTWTKSGHLKGRIKKIRTRAEPTAGSVAYALLLGYLTGARGQALFQTEYAKLLDCPVERGVELAEQASRQGWITFKRIGEIMELGFSDLISPTEMEWLREQN